MAQGSKYVPRMGKTMILTLEQIKKIAVGAVNVWSEDDGFHFAKCTDKQIAAWYAIRETLGERSEATTGVRLDFHTDSTRFAFEIKTGDRYEIYIDNILKYTYGPGNLEYSIQSITLDGNEHRITLYFPSHSVGVISNVELDDGAVLEPHKFDCRILFIGDSITQGWNTRWDSLSFAYGVSRFFNAESIIQGIGGSVFHETTFDEDLQFEPDIVCVAYGTNDWGFNETKEELRKHASLYLNALTKKYNNKKIFGISPIWRADTEQDKPMGSFEDCCDIVKDEIRKHGMILIEGEYMVPHLTDFYDDGFLHPNDVGFGIYTANLIAEMMKNN